MFRRKLSISLFLVNSFIAYIIYKNTRFLTVIREFHQHHINVRFFGVFISTTPLDKYYLSFQKIKIKSIFSNLIFIQNDQGFCLVVVNSYPTMSGVVAGSSSSCTATFTTRRTIQNSHLTTPSKTLTPPRCQVLLILCLLIIIYREQS